MDPKLPKMTPERHGKGWRYTIRIPVDCKQHYPGQTHLRFKPQEPDRTKADCEAFKWAAKVAADFARIRDTGSLIRTTISDAEIQALTKRLRYSVLNADEEIRTLGEYRDEFRFRQAVNELDESERRARAAVSRGDFGGIREIVLDWLRGFDYDLPEDSECFAKVQAKFAQTLAELNKAQRARNEGEWVPTPEMPQSVLTPTPKESASGPLLSGIVREFLGQQDKQAPMYRKYTVTLNALVEFLGDRPAFGLKQLDVERFLGALCGLPPRWADEKRKRGMSIADLARLEWETTISPKTFEDTYQAALRPFLTFAKRRYSDQGFPANLTASDGIKYLGKRTEGESKQRAMRPEELKRLFEGPEMTTFATDPNQAHCYWLPMVGLYSGARVNEVCQLNPQQDIAREGDIWFFNFSDETEGDERVTKSIKNAVSRRRVPVHPKLIEMGFLNYFEKVKQQGALLLFPQWKPIKGRASGEAEKWFRRLLSDTGLRDETPGARLVGFHAFRFTFENRAMNLGVANAEWITGHAGPESAVVRGYRGEAELAAKLKVIEKLVFDLGHPESALGRAEGLPSLICE